ncbi:MAG TPA: DUF167 domain-containing protein [Myxococcota bacterium]|nr:DUF167 domain-containing protein [Myxococcota bacterium]
MPELALVEHPDHCTLSVRVSPGSKRFSLAVRDDGVLLVRVPAKAVDGAANASLIKELAKALGMRRRQLRLVHGERSRDKILAVEAARDELIEALRRRIE